MLFPLTDAEIISTLQNAQRNNEGFLVLNLPSDRLQTSDVCELVILDFDESTKTVSQGKQSARLSPTQFYLLRYIYVNGKAGYEDLQDAVWGCATTDGAIRAAISKLNSALLLGGFGFELLAHRSRVSIERIA